MKKILLNVALALLAATSAFSADTKISALPDGSPAVATDRIPIARGAANFYIPFSAAWQVPSGSQFRGPDGSAAVPSFSFTSDTNTGIYLAGADFLAFAIGGAAPVAISTTQVVTTIAFRGPDGSAVAPTYSFSGNNALGFYNVGSNFVGFTNASGTQLLFGSASTRLGSGGQYTFSSAADPVSGAGDVGIARAGSNTAIRVTNGSTGYGAIHVKNGAVNAVGYGFETDLGSTGFWLNGTGNLVASTTNSARWQLNSAALRMKSDLPLTWSSGDPSTTGADTGLARNAANEVIVTDGLGNAGRLAYRFPVSAQTGSYTPSASVSSNYVFTNTGDADGSAATLPNDPIVGTTFTFAAVAAQDITITANTGETLMFGNNTCGTSLVVGGAATGIGDSVTVVAATGGSGAVWITTASAGTPVCTP